MSVAKEILYDWVDGNAYLFNAINGFSDHPLYIEAMQKITLLGDKRLFIVYVIITLIAALLVIMSRKIRHKAGNAQHYNAGWLGVIIMLFIGFFAYAGVTHILKEYFAYPRPYVVLGSAMSLFEPRVEANDYRSFPSGHVAFITFVIFSLWPMLRARMRWFGMALIVAVAWSRVALGMHFPADVFYAWLITMFLIGITRVFLYSILGRFGLRC